MEYQNTKDKGSVAELEVMCFLRKHGYVVSIPFGENAPYDLIAESPRGITHRIQVRFANWQGEVLKLSLRMVSKNYSRELDRSRIDVFVLWDGESPYIIPVEDTLNCRAHFSIRRKPAGNRQEKGIRGASKYKEALDLLP